MLLATDVADYLVGRGVPFRRAHEIVGALVRKLIAESREFESLSLADWQAASDLSTPTSSDRVTTSSLGGSEADAAVDSTRCGRSRIGRGSTLVSRE